MISRRTFGYQDRSGAGSLSGDSEEASAHRLSNGLRIKPRSRPAFTVFLLGLLVICAGYFVGYAVSDTGDKQTVQIMTVIEEYPRANGYQATNQVASANQVHLVGGLLKDGTSVEDVVTNGERESGYFDVWIRHHPGKAPEISGVPLPAKYPHESEGRLLMLLGAGLLVLAAIGYAVQTLFWWRRDRRNI